MKNLISIVMLNLVYLSCFAQEHASINPDIHDEVSYGLTLFFTTMVGLAIAGMLYMLYKIIVVEGNEEDEFDKRILSFFVGLLLVIAMDVIGNIKLSAIVIESFTNVNEGEVSNYIPAGAITIFSLLFGVFMAWQVHLKMKDFFISRRLFVLISTIVLFFMIRVYLVAINLEDLRPMIANLAFILGYALILIFTPKQVNPELEEEPNVIDIQTSPQGQVGVS